MHKARVFSFICAVFLCMAVLAAATIPRAILAFTLGSTTALADPLFGPRTDFGAGYFPSSVAVGDLNGDGTPDLVTANVYDNTVSVLLGNGDGTFAAKTDYRAGDNPWCVAIRDMNKDDKPDLAVANSQSSTVSVLLGNGDGTFAAKTDYGTGSIPVSVAIGDLNKDGKLDLAVAHESLNGVSVLLGNGDGTFAAKIDYGTGSIPVSVAIGDLNGNGKPDLVTANFGVIYFPDPVYPSTASVLLGNGDGTFAAKTDYQAGDYPLSIAIGDLNGDWRPDLAVANYGSNTVSVLLGNGDGTFAAKTDFGIGDGPRSVVISDLNGDWKPDLATANEDDATVSVLLGNGDGTFAAKTDYQAGDTPWCVAIGDMNNDGKPDLAVANPFSNVVSVLLNISPDIPTPTLVELFRAVSTAEGLRVEWQLSGPSAFQSIALDRGLSETGPWSLVRQVPPVQGQVTSVLDDAAAAGHTVWYRLSGVQGDGRSFTLAVISTAAQEAVTAFALSPPAPNPSTDRPLVTFTLPERTWVRMALSDVQGREVAVLADGILPAGRYTAALDVRSLGAGMYFVRMQAQGVSLTRRLVVVK